MLSTVIMDCRGLVDPQNKPFGRVLPLEVQVKIMFWVECFYTMDKRKKVVREIKGLPQCSMTGYPKLLGEGLHWNQVIVRLHAPRTNNCHHCHRLLDHRLSVSDFFFFSSHDLDTEKTFLSGFLDWHDGGDGTCPSQSGQGDERGHCLCYQAIRISDPRDSLGSASRHDWSKEALV